ncbi:MAG: alcohol dehydrogenase catalytic domain-containing protein [Planctomycetota bacterium]|jgi:NADPH:quinone reductase-like Zn-dependent oxidoreductase
MRAAVICEHGGLDCVKIDQVSEPEPEKDEVVLNVHSAGLNHLDIWMRKGRGGLKLTTPHILGSDASGIVTAIGSNVRNVSIGDEVILNPGLSCGSCEYCNQGE